MCHSVWELLRHVGFEVAVSASKSRFDHGGLAEAMYWKTWATQEVSHLQWYFRKFMSIRTENRRSISWMLKIILVRKNQRSRGQDLSKDSWLIPYRGTLLIASCAARPSPGTRGHRTLETEKAQLDTARKKRKHQWKPIMETTCFTSFYRLGTPSNNPIILETGWRWKTQMFEGAQKNMDCTRKTQAERFLATTAMSWPQIMVEMVGDGQE